MHFVYKMESSQKKYCDCDDLSLWSAKLRREQLNHISMACELDKTDAERYLGMNQVKYIG